MAYVRPYQINATNPKNGDFFYCRRDTVKTMVRLYARQMQLEMAGKESSAKILLDVMKDGDLEDKRLAKKAADMEVARIKKNKARLQPTTSTDTSMKAGQSKAVWSTRCRDHFRGVHSDATPALLCHKEPAQGTQSPLLGAFLPFAGSLWHKDRWLPCTERSY